MELHGLGSHSSVQCDTLCFELCCKAGCHSVYPALSLSLCSLENSRQCSTLPAFVQALSSLKGHHPGSFVSALMCWHSCGEHKGLVHVLQGECVEGSVTVPRVLGRQLKHRRSPASLLPSVAAALILSQMLPKTLLSKPPAPNYTLGTFGLGTCVWIWRFQTSGVI